MCLHKTFAVRLSVLLTHDYVNKYGFVSVINFLRICEKHSYLQLSIKLAI